MLIRITLVHKPLTKNNQVDMSDDEIPEDTNVHKQIWGKDANQVIYGEAQITNGIQNRYTPPQQSS